MQFHLLKRELDCLFWLLIIFFSFEDFSGHFFWISVGFEDYITGNELMFAVLWLLHCHWSENLFLQNNEMYSYIGLLLLVPMAASPALKMLWAVRLLCIQCLQQLDFLLPLCVNQKQLLTKGSWLPFITNPWLMNNECHGRG